MHMKPWTHDVTGEASAKAADRAAKLAATMQKLQGYENVSDVIAVARGYFGMDVAFVSEFGGEHRVLRYADPPDGQVKAGQSIPLDNGYCKRIVEGGLPQLIPDTAVDPVAAGLEATHSYPIGSHIGVPIILRDQRLYGTFCCFSASADASLNHRDLTVMHAFAELVASQIDRTLDADKSAAAMRGRLEAAIDGETLSTVFQPIVLLSGQTVVGVEALSRFDGKPDRTPDAWFAAAESLGLGVALECAAVRSALPALQTLPSDVYLAVNVSPATIMDQRFRQLFRDMPVSRIVLEVTEHANVPDYRALAAALAPPRARGLRLAVDDAGAGYSSLQHILNLKPDIIKLDMSLTRNVDADPVRRSLASALVTFAAEIGCQLVAEGVETEGELATLSTFGVTMGQGYHLGRPATLDEVIRRIGGD